MTEILTESFCERCGTRYTFESARPHVRLKGVRVLSRGLKNFVLSDDNSIDEAMAAARSDTDRELTAHQLDAFHKTFNFCMSCRQYTCPNCWNEAEARCLTCAPNLGQEVMPAPFPDLVTSSYLVADPVEAPVSNGSNGSNGHDVIEDPSTSGVDTSDFAARLQALMAPPDLEKPAETVAETVVAAQIVDEVLEAPVEAPVEIAEPTAAAAPAEVAADVDEPPEAVTGFEAGEIEDLAVDDEHVAADIGIAAAAAEVAESDESDEAAEIAARLAAWGAAAAAFDAATDDAPDSADAAQSGAAQTGGLLRRFRAGQNLDAELDAYERDQTETPMAEEPGIEAVAAAAIVADEPEVEPEPVAAVEPETEVETIAAAEPETFAADEPEVLAAAEPEALAAPEPEVAAAQAETPAEPQPIPVTEPVDVVQQPTWRMVAPDPTIDVPATPPDSPSIPAAATAPDANAEPQWPARPGAAPSVGLPFLNRPPAATGGLDALWAESARDVVAPPTVAGRPVATGGVQPCVSCGLSLSATARFCRRCGTHQAV